VLKCQVITKKVTFLGIYSKSHCTADGRLAKSSFINIFYSLPRLLTEYHINLHIVLHKYCELDAWQSQLEPARRSVVRTVSSFHYITHEHVLSVIYSVHAVRLAVSPSAKIYGVWWAIIRQPFSAVLDRSSPNSGACNGVSVVDKLLSDC